jgi:hypothetical protein
MYLPDLMDAILSAGLFQFGAFHQADKHNLYRLRFELLPSYPAVLAQAASAVTKLIDGRPSRLVCTNDSIALATIVGQTLEIPLVVHTGKLGQPAHNLIGAYDVGHAAVLISLSTDYSPGFVEKLVDEAAGVGLQIVQWVSLVGGINPVNELRHVAAIDLRDIAEYLVDRGEVSAQMAGQIFNKD